MNGCVTRDAWQKALLLPTKTLTRDQRMTLLMLSHLMTKSGRLSRPEIDLVKAAQVDRRTVARHRQAAVDTGWLVRESAGGYRHVAVYRASLPDTQVSQSDAYTESLRDTDDAQSPVTVRHPTGCSDKPLHDTHVSPSSKDLYGETAAGHFIFTFGSQRGHLLGGELRQSKPEPRTHADHAHDSGPLLADFDLGLRLTAPHEAGLRLARETA